ncbi:MAG: hypothetical protein ACK456_01665, partial [Pseudanabaenaceae cyanobacterium]
IGTGGGLTVGSVDASATHKGNSSADADGRVTSAGTAAIGLAIGLNIVDDITTSGTGRSITATNGGVSFGAFSYAATGATGTASAAGGADKSQTKEQTTDEQVGSQLDGASNISGNSKASSKKSKTNGKAQTGGGKSVSVAGGIALNLVSSIANAYVADNLTINAAGVLAVQSSNETDASAIADGSATGGAPSFGVGVAVALNIVDITNTGTVGNNATINAKGVTLSALTNKSLGNDGYSNFTVKATSGASSGDVGVAGSLALNLIGTNQSLATVKSGTVNAGGGDVTITAENNTKASTIAEAAQTASGDASKFGLGLSAAIDITDNSAIANITDGLTLINANKLTLKATSDNSSNTSAKAGAGSDKVAISGALALNLVSNTTTATIGTGGGLTVGSVDASATHKGNSTANADGRVTSAGTAGIGLAIGLNIVDDITTSGTGRNITATNGGVSFGAFSYAATGATGTASAAGGKEAATKADGKKETADDQVSSQLSGTDSITGNTKGSSKTSKTNGKSQTNQGSVSVAGGLALNLVSSIANAYVADNLTISATGALAVQSSNETDASAIADGSASGGATKYGIGVAVALNIVDIQNTATVGSNATVNAVGVTVTALTNKSLGDGYSNFTVKATSGASATDVGVAGSFALNLVGTNQSLATIKSGTVNAGGGDFTLAAENNTKATTTATALQTAIGGDSTKLGLGLSAAIDITDNSAIASVSNSLTINNANKLTLKATSDNSHITTAKAGADGGGKVGIGGALALTLVNNNTEAVIYAGAGALSSLAVGSVDASATHKGNSAANADGKVGGGGTAAIGLAIGLNIVDDITTSGTERNITANNGGVSFGAFNYAASSATGTASAAGGKEAATKSDGKKETSEDQAKSSMGSADKITGNSSKTSSKQGAIGGKSQTDKGSVSVAGGLALNLADSKARAFINDNLSITATGAVAVQSSNETDGSAIADGSATGGQIKYGIGVAVALNIVDTDNSATVGAGTTISGKGLTVTALTNKSLGNDGYSQFTAKATSGASASDVGVAGSFALNLILDNSSIATVKSTVVNAGGGDITIAAENNTKSSTIAEASQTAIGGDNTKLGLGLSAAIDIIDNSAQATIIDGVTVNSAGNVNMSATSDNTNVTKAKAGADGGGKVGIGGALTLNLISNTTTAYLGTGNTLNAASFSGKAVHKGFNTTETDATVFGGKAAIGAAISLNIVDETTTAIIARNITATTGGVGVEAYAYEYHSADAQASAMGEKPKDQQASGQQTAGGQAGSQLDLANSIFGGGKTSSNNTKKSSINSNAKSKDGGGDSGGSVSVSAALALNFVNSTTAATINNGLTINAAGVAKVRTSNETDALAIADGKAVDPENSKVGVGVGVALNIVDISNRATIGNNVTLTSNGLDMAANISDPAVGGGNGVGTFSAKAIAGAGATKVGVAGAFALNLINKSHEAVIKSGANVNTGNGAITMTASNNDTVFANATSKATGGKVGVGASIALNLLNTDRPTTIRAEIEDGVTFNANGGSSLTVTATSARTVTTTVEAGAGGADVSVAPAVAVVVGETKATARIGSGSGTINLTGPVNILATHAGNTIAGGDAVAAGNKVAVGAIVAVNVAIDNTAAQLMRNLSTSSGAVNIIASSALTSTAKTQASASGNDDLGRSADQEAGAQSGKSNLPTAQGGVDQGNSSGKSQSGGGGSGVGVAAAVSVNWQVATNEATIGDGVTVNTQGGAVRVSVVNQTDATAKAVGTSIDTSTQGKKVGIGAAVGLNVATVNNIAKIGSNAVVNTKGASSAQGNITVEAITPVGASNEFEVWGLAAAGGAQGDAAIAGSVGVNIVLLRNEAYVGSGAQLTTNGGLNISATSPVNLQNIAASLAFSPGKAAVGAAVSVNVVDHNTQAYIADNAVINAGEAINITASNSIAPKAIVAEDFTDVVSQTPSPIAQKLGELGVTVSSVTIGGGVTSGKVGIGGSVIVDVFTVKTKAFISKGVQINQTATAGSNQSVNLRATNNIDTFNIAGGLGVSTGAAGIGLSINASIINRDVAAYVDSSNAQRTRIKAAKDITVNSSSSEKVFALTLAGGVANNAGIGGSINVLVITQNVGSAIGDYATAEASGKMDVNASDTAGNTSNGTKGIELYAGSLGAAGTAGVGVSNTTLVRVSNVGATIGSNATIKALGSTGLGIKAIQDVNAYTFAIGFAGGGTAAVAGSATINVLTNTTTAGIGSNTVVDAANVDIGASDRTKILGLAGSVAVGGTAGVGLGVDVGVITKNTSAYIGSGAVVNSAKDVNVISTSSEDIFSLSAGAAAAGDVAVVINAGVSVHVINTSATIGSNAVVVAQNNVNVSASEQADLLIAAGNLSASGTASVGAAAVVPILIKNTEASIGSGAQVTGLAKQNTNNAVATGTSAGGVAVTAYTRNKLDGIAITAGGSGNVAVNIGGNVTVMAINTLAHVDRGAKINTAGNNAGAGAGQSVVVAASNRLEQTSSNPASGTAVGVSVSGTVSVAPGVNVRVLNFNTKAYIENETETNAAKDVQVTADSNVDFRMVTAGLAGSGNVAVGGAIAVAVVGSTTEAYIGEAATNADGSANSRVAANASQGAKVSAGGNVQVAASNLTKVDSYVGALGLGLGTAGVGASINVIVLNKTTQAYIGALATVDAKAQNTSPIGGDKGVIVSATSSETIIDGVFVGAGGLYAGVAGGVNAVVVNSDTNAFIDQQTKVNTINNASAGSDQSVKVTARNSFSGTSIVGAASGGLVGVSGAFDVGVVRNNATSYIGSGATVYAKKDIGVSALSDKNLLTTTISIGGGGVSVNGSVGVWSFGSGGSTDYNDGGDKSDSADLKNSDGSKFDSSQFADDQASGGDQNAKSGQTQVGWQRLLGNGNSVFKDDGDASTTTSQDRMASGVASAQSSMSNNASNGKVRNTLNARPTQKGTNASVDNGAILQAGGSVAVTANNTYKTLMIVGDAGGGGVAVGVSIVVLNIADNTTARIGNNTTIDALTGNVDVSANRTSDIKGLSFAGKAGGSLALGAQVVVMRDASSQAVTIGSGSTFNQVGGSIRASANSNHVINSDAAGLNIGGTAIGVVVSVVESSGDTTVDIGAINAGQSANPAQTVGGLSAIATTNNDARATATAVSAGIGGGALAGDLGIIILKPTTRASIADNARIKTTGNVTVQATNTQKALNLALSVAVDGLAGIGGSFAVTTIESDTHASIGNNAVVHAGGNMTIAAVDDAGDDNNKKLETYAGSLGAAGAAGVGISSATLVKTTNVSATIGSNSSIKALGTNGLGITAQQTAQSYTLAIGFGGGGAAGVAGSATVEVFTNSTIASIGNNTTVEAGDVRLAATDTSKLLNVAGSLAVGGAAGVGVGVDVVVLTKNTQATIGSNSTITSAKDINAVATSRENITSVSASASAGGVAAASINAGVSVLNITTRAGIGSGTTAIAQNNVNISAREETDIDMTVGNVTVSGTGSIGAAVNVPVVIKTTEAYIGANASVTGLAQNGTTNSSANGNIPSAGGVAVTASNRDNLGVRGISGGAAGGVAINIGGVVNVVTANTIAHIDQGARINTANGTAGAGQSVVVAATNSYTQQSISGGISGAGLGGVAPAADVRVLNFNTKAYIEDNTQVNAALDVRVIAKSSENISSYVNGAAGGGLAGIGGAVGVTVINNQTYAYIGNSASDLTTGAKVLAGGNVQVAASDDTNILAQVGALGVGGIAGLGASISVITISKDTRAFVGNNATIDAKARTYNPINVYTDQENFGNGNLIVQPGAGLVVQATTSETINSYVLAGGGGLFGGLAGAITVNVVSSDTTAYLGTGVQVNGNNDPNDFNDVGFGQGVYVSAYNKAVINTLTGAISGAGLAAVSGAFDVGVVRNNTTAKIGNNSAIQAKGAVAVAALSERSVNSLTISGGLAGYVGVSGAVSVWNIGTGGDFNYSDRNEDGTANNSKSANAMPDDTQSFADKQARGDQGNSGWKKMLGSSFKDDNKSASNANRIKAATDSTTNTMNSKVAEGSVSGAIDARPSYLGTSAVIGTGVTVNAGNNVTVNGKNKINFGSVVGNVSGGGLAGIGASITVANIAENTEARIGAGSRVNATGGMVSVNATMLENASGAAYAGNASGFVGLGAQIVVIKDSSSQYARIDDGASFESVGGAVQVTATAKRNVTANAVGVAISGLVSGGLVLAYTDVSGSTIADIGNSVQMGQSFDPNKTVGGVDVAATSNIVAKADAVGVAASLGFAVNGSAAIAIVNPNIRASIGNTSNIKVTGEASIKSISTGDVRSDALGVAVGALGGAAGGSIALAFLTPNIQTSIGQETNLEAGGSVTMKALHNYDDETETALNNQVTARAIAGAGGSYAGLAGSWAQAKNTPNINLFAGASGNDPNLSDGQVPADRYGTITAGRDVNNINRNMKLVAMANNVTTAQAVGVSASLGLALAGNYAKAETGGSVRAQMNA